MPRYHFSLVLYWNMFCQKLEHLCLSFFVPLSWNNFFNFVAIIDGDLFVLDAAKWLILLYNSCIISLCFFTRELRPLTSWVMIKRCIFILTNLLNLGVYLRPILIYFPVLFICSMIPFGYIVVQIYMDMNICTESTMH